MRQKTYIIASLLLACVAMHIQAGKLYAEEKSGFSVGHESLSTSKGDPKSRNIGSVTARYGFGSSSQLKTYLGTGLAYSYAESSEQNRQPRQNEAVPGLKTGVAGQAGINYQLGGNVSLSVDYQYLRLQPDVRGTNGNEPAQKVGVGVDIKF